MDEYGTYCCNCSKPVNLPDARAVSPEDHRNYLVSRPQSFWVNTPSGETKALCYPCSWNPVITAMYSKQNNNSKTPKKSLSVIQWLLIIFLVSSVLGGMLTMSNSTEISDPSSGYEREWNADNSIEGPVGNFDDQSKR